MKTSHDIIIKPIISEKSMENTAFRSYTFKVAIDANKIQIRKAIEEIFGVKVEKVNTVRMLGKMKRMGKHIGKRPDWKKAIIKLTPESKGIEYFEGMS